MTKIALVFLLLIAAFLGGYLPEHSKASKLQDELQAARQEAAMARLRDLSATMYIQASQKNYGLASKTSAVFYGLLQRESNKQFDELLATREKIASGLSKGDPEVMNDLHPLFLKTQELAK